MSAEMSTPSQDLQETLLPDYEERFRKLNAGIIESLNPDSNIIVFSTNPENPTEGWNFSLDKKGSWRIGFGDCCPTVLGPDLLRLLIQYNYSRSLVSAPPKGSESIKELRERAISAGKNLNEAASGFLGSMQRALEKYRQNTIEPKI